MESIQQVPWISKRAIAFRAGEVVRQYSHASGESTSVPVPVEALMEFKGLTLEYGDLEEMLGIPDVMGATWVKKRLVIINNKLLTGVEGRVAFTCAHELGHWELHRNLVETESINREGRPSIFCRERDAKMPLEWQADYFAASLLMPENLVRDTFYSCFGPSPLVMHNENSSRDSSAIKLDSGMIIVDPALDTARDIASLVIVEGGFSNVSRQAMQFRLEELDLLINRIEPQKTSLQKAI